MESVLDTRLSVWAGGQRVPGGINAPTLDAIIKKNMVGIVGPAAEGAVVDTQYRRRCRGGVDCVFCDA